MADQNYLKGIRAAKSGKYAEASLYLAKTVQADPKNEEAWLLLGHCQTNRKKRRFCYESVLKLNPSNEMARISLQQLAPDGPAPDADSSTAFPPASVEGIMTESASEAAKRTQFGNIWGGHLRTIMIGFLAAMGLITVAVAGLTGSGMLDGFIRSYILQPQVETALPGYDQAASTQFGQLASVDAYTRRALDLMDNRDYAGAIRSWGSVIELAPQNDNAYYQRARCWYFSTSGENVLSVYRSSLQSA